MAINPNTDFSAGAVLLASQMNRFPRGVMAYNTVTSSSSSFTTEAVQITSSSFTAVANRYYKITYYEPYLVGTATYLATLRIRLTNISGTVLNTGQSFVFTPGDDGHAVAITTLTAGATTLVATLAFSSLSNATRSSTQYAFLLVEDIGPA